MKLEMTDACISDEKCDEREISLEKILNRHLNDNFILFIKIAKDGEKLLMLLCK